MFARGSLVWLATPLTVALVILSVSIWKPSAIGLAVSSVLIIATALLACFFRDPDRSIGDGVVSPADGRVALSDPEGRKLSIVLGLSNVHVTRAPLKGEVARLKRLKGGHRPAFRETSEKNERLEMGLSSDLGDARMVLMTGFAARRVKSYVAVGDKVSKGDRVGIIMFGSRVDLHLPESCRITARQGQVVRAGESQVAEVVDDPA